VRGVSFRSRGAPRSQESPAGHSPWYLHSIPPTFVAVATGFSSWGAIDGARLPALRAVRGAVNGCATRRVTPRGPHPAADVRTALRLGTGTLGPGLSPSCRREAPATVPLPNMAFRPIECLAAIKESVMYCW
jgi:hypothetical protein